MTEAVQPEGWYDDPDEAGFRRYWDGSVWTDRRFDMAARKRREALKRVANLIGLVFLVPFLLISFIPSSSGSLSCGTWISDSTSTSVAVAQLDTGLNGATFDVAAAQVDCQNKLANRRLWALILLGVGLVVRFSFVPVVETMRDTGKPA